ncbi:MAG: hypothetical protein N3B16_12320 [Candidatus Aminicenantes bacterium]|nr:hypothetical protein [Candidatus Aminicenantes bacterium]
MSTANNSCGEPQIACDNYNRLFAVWWQGEGDESEIWMALIRNILSLVRGIKRYGLVTIAIFPG